MGQLVLAVVVSPGQEGVSSRACVLGDMLVAPEAFAWLLKSIDKMRGHVRKSEIQTRIVEECFGEALSFIISPDTSMEEYLLRKGMMQSDEKALCILELGHENHLTIYYDLMLKHGVGLLLLLRAIQQDLFMAYRKALLERVQEVERETNRYHLI